MLCLGVICLITQPTDCCTAIVVMLNRNGTIRLCVDLTHLNKAIKRMLLQLPSEAEILSQLNGSTIFSKLDVTSFYWQIPLTEKRQLLTMFITPFHSASALPQNTSRKECRKWCTCPGVPGVVCCVDDILVSDQGKGQAQHDVNLAIALQRLSGAGAIQKSKCEFSRHFVALWGNQISVDGVRPLPGCTQASEHHRSQAILGHGQPTRQVHPVTGRRFNTDAVPPGQ